LSTNSAVKEKSKKGEPFLFRGSTHFLIFNATKTENQFIKFAQKLLICYKKGNIKVKVWIMEGEMSRKYAIGNGAPLVVKARWVNDGDEETCPLRSEKRSGQILLTFDAWFESTRGARMGRESRRAKRNTGLFGEAFFTPFRKSVYKPFTSGFIKNAFG
jgi:hypothetical protein